MPCRYDPTPEEIAQARKARDAKLIKPYLDKLDKLTRLLCESTKKLKDNSKVSKELKEWMIQHEKEDKAREEKDKLLKEKKLLESKLAKINSKLK